MAGGALFAFVLTSSILPLFFVPISSIPDSKSDRVYSNTTTMFLPLFLHNNRREIDSYPQRRLQNNSHRTARMFLHDDLLLNGYYTSRLWIGSPPQMFALIVDTGSTVTYVPCATCEQCGKHQDPKFQPDLSSTYKPVKCNIDCPCDSDRKQCTYERQYAEMSSSSGVLGDDVVSFGNQSELEPQRAVFGCENMETGAGSDASKLSKSFPSVEMVFANGQKLLLSPENYLFRHSKMRGSYCLGIFQNGKDPTTLLGGIVVRNTLVTYDREHERIGFWKTNCSELWERLNISPAPPPLPSGLNQTNSSMATSPTLAPSEPPPFKGPGGIKIGLITFSMLLSVKYSDLKPHIPELSRYISKELDVNASQVQLMNFTSRENDTLLRWAITPAESSDYISNSAAMDIISKLNENRLHLPDSFGNFKLFEWNIEPPQERTWWQQYYLVVVSFAVILGIGILASGAWFIWRRERSTNPYKPVESIIAEQELQPLQNS